MPPGAAPTPAHLLRSAAAGLRNGRPCAIRGDVFVGPTAGAFDVVSSVSTGDRFRATITRHLPSSPPLALLTQFIDDGTARYYRSAPAMRLEFDGKVPARLAGRWVRFPSWQTLSQHAYNSTVSRLSHYPGQAGQALVQMMEDSISMPYQGGSCRLLLADLRDHVDTVSRAVQGKLAGQPVLRFTIANLFSALTTQRYQITVNRSQPVRVLRITSGKDVLTLSYPSRISPISAPPAADVIPAQQVPALSQSHSRRG